MFKKNVYTHKVNQKQKRKLFNKIPWKRGECVFAMIVFISASSVLAFSRDNQDVDSATETNIFSSDQDRIYQFKNGSVKDNAENTKSVAVQDLVIKIDKTVPEFSTVMCTSSPTFWLAASTPSSLLESAYLPANSYFTNEGRSGWTNADVECSYTVSDPNPEYNSELKSWSSNIDISSSSGGNDPWTVDASCGSQIGKPDQIPYCNLCNKGSCWDTDGCKWGDSLTQCEPGTCSIDDCGACGKDSCDQMDGCSWNDSGTFEKCEISCGNGNLNPEYEEECDDGGVSPEDGCSASCTIEPGWECPTPGAPCIRICNATHCDGCNTSNQCNTTSGCKWEDSQCVTGLCSPTDCASCGKDDCAKECEWDESIKQCVEKCSPSNCGACNISKCPTPGCVVKGSECVQTEPPAFAYDFPIKYCTENYLESCGNGGTYACNGMCEGEKVEMTTASPTCSTLDQTECAPRKDCSWTYENGNNKCISWNPTDDCTGNPANDKTIMINNQEWSKCNSTLGTDIDGIWSHPTGIGGGYGKLYDWANRDSACPSGWHVPTDAEWKTLVESQATTGCETSTGRQCDPAGTRLKESGSSGFSALFAGTRSWQFGFMNRDYTAFFWSSSTHSFDSSWYRYLRHDDSTVRRGNFNKENGVSVRCIKGAPESTCGVDQYKSGENCIDVGIGNYSPDIDNELYECTIPKNGKPTSSGEGRDNCLWSCASGYKKSGEICIEKCSEYFCGACTSKYECVNFRAEGKCGWFETAECKLWKPSFEENLWFVAGPDGWLFSCNTSHCVMIQDGLSKYPSAAIFDGRMWASGEKHMITFEKDTYDDFQRVNYEGHFKSAQFVTHDNKIWFTDGNYDIWSCTASGTCSEYNYRDFVSDIYVSGPAIQSIEVFNNELWISTKWQKTAGTGGRLYACSLDSENCTLKVDIGKHISDMIVFDNKLWFRTLTPIPNQVQQSHLYSCNSSGNCSNHGQFGQFNGGYKSIEVFNNKIWFVGKSNVDDTVNNHLYSCDKAGSCTDHGQVTTESVSSRFIKAAANKLWIGYQEGSLFTCNSSGSCTLQFYELTPNSSISAPVAW